MIIKLLYKSVLRNNKGSSLINTIGFISFISLLSISAVTTTTSGLKSAGLFKNNQIAYYNAQAGLEYATYYVKTLGFTTASLLLAANKNTSTNLMLDCTNLTAIKAASTDATFPKFASNTAFNGGSYYVYVSNDLLDTNGKTSPTDANSSVTFTSIGYGPNKTTFAVVQGTYTYTYTAGGSNPNIVQDVNGAGGVIGGNNVKIDTANNFDMTTAGHNSIATNSNNPTKTGGGAVSNSQAQSPPFDTAAHAMAYYQRLKTVATNAGTLKGDTTYGNTVNLATTIPASSTAPVVVNGNLTVGNSFSGKGILVVTGTLTAGNGFTWEGLVLIIGKGTFNFGNNLNITGSIIVAGMNNDINAGTSTAWADVNFHQTTTGGGTSRITYDSTKWSNIDQGSGVTSGSASGASSISTNRTSWRQM